MPLYHVRVYHWLQTKMGQKIPAPHDLNASKTQFPTWFPKSQGIFRYMLIYLGKNKSLHFAENFILWYWIPSSLMLRLLHAFSLMLFLLPYSKQFFMPTYSFRKRSFVDLTPCTWKLSFALCQQQKHLRSCLAAEQLPLHLVSYLQLQQDIDSKLCFCPHFCLITCNAQNNWREERLPKMIFPCTFNLNVPTVHHSNQLFRYCILIEKHFNNEGHLWHLSAQSVC